MKSLRARSRATVLVAVMLSVVGGMGGVGGCGKNTPPAPSNPPPADEAAKPAASNTAAPPATPPATPPAGAAQPGGREQPRVELLAPGSEPRQPLRYRLVAGAAERLVMRMTTSVKTESGGAVVSAVDTPTIEMHMRLQIAEKLSETEARYEFVLEDIAVTARPGVTAEVVEATRAALGHTKGMAGSAIVDTRGFNRELQMKLPEGMPAEMAQMLNSATQGIDQISAPFPEEAVGKGAQWELHQVIAQNGMKLDQVTLFELVELDGRTGVLRATVKQSAAKQPVSLPGMPPGSVELLELTSLGSGTTRFALDKLVPRSSLTLRSDYSMRVTLSDQPQDFQGHLDMDMEVESR